MLQVLDASGGLPGQYVAVHAQAGNLDEAFRRLEDFYEERSPELAGLLVSRHLDPLHADPRWADLLARVGRD